LRASLLLGRSLAFEPISLLLVQQPSQLTRPPQPLFFSCMLTSVAAVYVYTQYAVAMSSFKRPQSSYEASFKLCIIEFAENSNNSAAECQYGISEVDLLVIVTVGMAGT